MTKPKDVLYEKALETASKRGISKEKQRTFVFGYIDGFIDGKEVEVIPYDTSFLLDDSKTERDKIADELEKIQVHLLVFQEYKIEGYVDHAVSMMFKLLDNLRKDDKNG